MLDDPPYFLLLDLVEAWQLVIMSTSWQEGFSVFVLSRRGNNACCC
jgi:hypothetical protein